jgi:hypothetical protein
MEFDGEKIKYQRVFDKKVSTFKRRDILKIEKKEIKMIWYEISTHATKICLYSKSFSNKTEELIEMIKPKTTSPKLTRV